MSWQMSGGDDPKPYWVEDGIGNQSDPPGVGANAGGTSTPATGGTSGGNTVATTPGRWHPDSPIPNWPQYPSGDLAPYNGGYANLADQIRASFGLADGLSSSPFYGQGAGRYSYAQGMGDGKAFPKNAGRSAPWLGNGLFPSFGGVQQPAQPTAPAGGGLLGSTGNSQPVPSVTTNGKPPTKDASGLLGAAPANGGAGSTTNPGYIPGVNLPYGQVPSTGAPLNQYGGPTGADLSHLWGESVYGDPGTYFGPATNMSASRYAQYMADLQRGITRDESSGMGYINGQAVK
jgi:hypothetical protein